MASRKLRHYFEAFKVRVTLDTGLGELFRNPEASVQIAKWVAELSGYHITFEPRTTIKSQILADFIVDWTGPTRQQEEPPEKVWTIHYDGAWCHAGAGAAVIITSPTDIKHRYTARHSFALESDRCTNNIAEYEVVILGLRKLRVLGVTTYIVKTDSKVVVGQVEKNIQQKTPHSCSISRLFAVLRDSSRASPYNMWTAPGTKRPTHWLRQRPEARPYPPTCSTTSSAHQLSATQRAYK
jgi:ribonuclease HI